MKFDMHTHHQRCGHASGTIEDYIREVLRQGAPITPIRHHHATKLRCCRALRLTTIRNSNSDTEANSPSSRLTMSLGPCTSSFPGQLSFAHKIGLVARTKKSSCSKNATTVISKARFAAACMTSSDTWTH